jgi:hypothetical protein
MKQARLVSAQVFLQAIFTQQALPPGPSFRQVPIHPCQKRVCEFDCFLQPVWFLMTISHLSGFVRSGIGAVNEV